MLCMLGRVFMGRYEVQRLLAEGGMGRVYLARQLDPEQFARISRSELVNLDRIKEMQPWFHGERRIVLRDGRELTWTRRFRASSSRA